MTTTRDTRFVGAVLAGTILAGAVLVLPSRHVHADAVDPNVPSTVTVGAPRGAVTQARLDERRRGLSRTSFPESPAELWRRSLGTVEVSPLVDEAGAITIALASAEVVKLGAGGKELWRARMQGGGPASPPIRLSDGTVAVVSTGGLFVGVSERGKVRFATQLGARGPDLVAPPIALEDGGAALVAGRSLYTLDADGAIATETILPAHVSTAPIVAEGELLVIGDDGSVMRVRPPKQPQKVGTFQVMLDGGAVLADDRTLLGVTRDRLLALDLKTGVVSVRASTGSFASIDGPVVVSGDKSVYFTTSEGLLFGIDHTGQEIARATVERTTPPPQPAGYPGGPGFPSGYPPGSYPPAYYGQAVRQNPALVIDPHGRIAFVRSAGRFGVAGGGTSGSDSRRRKGDASQGSQKGDGSSGAASGLDAAPLGVDVVSERVCNTPLAVLPAGEGRLVVVCREGLVAVFGD